MNIPSALVEHFPPSADLLLEHTRRCIDDAVLEQIANADYGEMANEMLAELRPIRDQGVLPKSVHWQLSEVLHLTRNLDPDPPDECVFEYTLTGLRAHSARLFACALLLRLAAESGTGYHDANMDSTLALALTSSKVFADEMNSAFGRFLTWRILRPASELEPLMFGLGLLVISARSPRVTEHELAMSAEWVLGLEEKVVSELEAAELGGSRFEEFGGDWQPLAIELKSKAAAAMDECTRENVRLCALIADSS